MTTARDPRRYRIIETRFRGNAARYNLTIDGVLWSEVEWSASRRAWCIQDAAGGFGALGSKIAFPRWFLIWPREQPGIPHAQHNRTFGERDRNMRERRRTRC